MKPKGTLLALMSDTHSGGDTALFPSQMLEWGVDKKRNHTPNSLQLKMHDVFMRCAEYARLNNPGRLIVVHDGDAIEACHHDTQEVHTLYIEDHVDTHIFLMKEFLNKSGHSRKRGDKLYYTTGTDAHSPGRVEYDIAEEMNADGIFNVLKIELHGKLIWCYHNGRARGSGANKGNALRNSLRDIYFDCKSRGERPPDLVVSAHTHAHNYNTFVYDMHTIHGIILPSWQAKTRYVNGKMPTAVNEIGMAFVRIAENEDVKVLQFILMDTDQEGVIKI